MVASNPSLAESRSRQLKQGLIIHEGTSPFQIKSGTCTVWPDCGDSSIPPSLVLFMITTTNSGMCFSDQPFRQVFWILHLKKKKHNVWWKCVDITRNLCVGEDDAHNQVWFSQIQIGSDRDGKVEKERKKKCSRQAGRKKDVRKSNIKEKAVSTRWSMLGDSLQFLCRQQLPCKSMGDSGYSLLLLIRLQINWDAYVWNRIPSSGQIFLQILVLECFYPVTWRAGTFMVTSPQFLHSSELKPGLRSGPFPLLQCV